MIQQRHWNEHGGNNQSVTDKNQQEKIWPHLINILCGLGLQENLQAYKYVKYSPIRAVRL